MNCATHPERPAAGVCTRCGNFFCQECLVQISGKNLCRTCVTAAFEEQKQQQPAFAQHTVPFVINNNNNNSASSSAAAAAAAAAAPSAPGMYMPVVRKSAGLAAVLSFFIPGLGQLYCGRLGRGIMFFLGSVLLAPIFIGLGIWIWGIIDAYALAERYPMP